MKFFKNKFFIIILSAILLIFAYQFYKISQSYKVDRNSYVTLVKWSWILTSDQNKIVLKIDKKELLKSWDIVSIIWNDSLWIIEWWDKSITRLSWNSKVMIKENFVSDALDKINISFELLKWKTWSNVITIMWENSYFKQDIKSVTASVRWTVFEADYDNDYVYVQDHEVNVSNEFWQAKTLYSWDWVLLQTFSLDKVLALRDKFWEDLNESLDNEYYNKLKEEFLERFWDNWFFQLTYDFFMRVHTDEKQILTLLWTWDFKWANDYFYALWQTEKEKVLEYLKTFDQSVNFEDWSDEQVYDMKLAVRSMLIDNTTSQDYKELLLKYTMYDLNSMFDFDKINQAVLEKTMDLLEKNKQYIDLSSTDFISVWKNYDLIKEFLINWNSDVMIEKVKWKLNDLNDAWKNIINKWLDSALEFFKK